MLHNIKNIYIFLTFTVFACAAADGGVVLPNRSAVEMKCMNVPALEDGADLGIEMKRCENHEVVCYQWMSLAMECKFK